MNNEFLQEDEPYLYGSQVWLENSSHTRAMLKTASSDTSKG